MTAIFKARQRLGKYRIIARLSNGPLAAVYKAHDTVQQISVALKVAHLRTSSMDEVEDFVSEARIASKLDHPNILRVDNATFIDDWFVIAMPLGIESLAARMERRIGNARAQDLAMQSIRALAFAHDSSVIHCDIKPENYILFPDHQLKLADFGFSKVSKRTVRGSGSGTIDYIAPEQAMGKPRFASDVFSLGLVLYRLFGGHLPEYPFDWPPPSLERVAARTNDAFVDVLRQALQIDPRARFRDAGAMLAAAQRAMSGARRQKSKSVRAAPRGPTWRRTRWREFSKRYGKALALKSTCRRCEGPVAMEMQACPWCGTDNPAAGKDQTMPAHCPRCERGVKLDWQYCAWCYGAGFEAETNRRFPDKRYNAKCSNSDCKQPLMPHMRYCPWCRGKVRRRWPMERGDASCKNCEQPVAAEFWRFCAWCREPVSESGQE
ncbi:MAG: protein kinase [Woeseiaceae bacterium]